MYAPALLFYQRLVESKTGTEVYGIAGTSEWVTDSSKDYFHDTETSDYIRMTGNLMYNFASRVYTRKMRRGLP